MTVKLLGLSGSLRRDSANTAVLRTLQEALPAGATLNIFPLNDLPLYDEDLDTETPPAAVAVFRAAIGAADGLIIASPEYNYGIPGGLKNALDWASRPYGRATIAGKPVLTLTASPAFTGGVRAQVQLNETVLAIGARLVQRPQTVIPAVHEKLRNGLLVDEATLNFLLAGVRDLIAEVRSAELRVAA